MRRSAVGDPQSLLTLTIEVPKGRWPIRGHVAFPGEEPKPFRGWAELRTLVNAFLGRPHAIAGGLTPEERRVASLVCEGLSNPEIARALVVSERTVYRHLERIFRKLGVQTRMELIAEWLQRTILEDPDALEQGAHRSRAV